MDGTLEDDLFFHVEMGPFLGDVQMGVSKNKGTPIMENPIKMDDLGIPLFLETPKCLLRHI